MDLFIIKIRKIESAAAAL